MTLHSLPASCITFILPWLTLRCISSYNLCLPSYSQRSSDPCHFRATGVWLCIHRCTFCGIGRALLIMAFSIVKSLRHISRQFYSFCPKKKRNAKLQLVILTDNKLHNNIFIILSNTPYSSINCKSALCDQYKTILCL